MLSPCSGKERLRTQLTTLRDYNFYATQKVERKFPSHDLLKIGHSTSSFRAAQIRLSAHRSAKKVSDRDHKGLRALSEEAVDWQRMIVVSRDKTPMKYPSGIEHLYWEDFLRHG